MGTFLLVLLLLGAGCWLYHRFGWYLDMQGLANHVTESLYGSFLAPIERQVYTLKGPKTEIIFDANLAHNIIAYVRESDRLLKAFYHVSWDVQTPGEKRAWKLVEKYESAEKRELKRAWRIIDKAKRRRTSCPEYFLWEKMEERFIHAKTFSLTGQDLSDPFAYWVRELYPFVRSGTLNTSDIEELHVCQHGEIAFKTRERNFNIDIKTGKFRCGDCSTPRDILKVSDE